MIFLYVVRENGKLSWVPMSQLSPEDCVLCQFLLFDTTHYSKHSSLKQCTDIVSYLWRLEDQNGSQEIKFKMLVFHFWTFKRRLHYLGPKSSREGTVTLFYLQSQQWHTKYFCVTLTLTYLLPFLKALEISSGHLVTNTSD